MARISLQAPDVVDQALPLNVTIVLDSSGSMGGGNRLQTATAAARAIVDSLGPQDRVAVIHFESVAELLDPHTAPGRSSHQAIGRLYPGGSTNVQAAVNLQVSA